MKIKANAKINLSLKICGKRHDGYHLIDTVMHSVSLFDIIEINKADHITVKCDKYDIRQEDNIAFKAAELFLAEYGIKSGARIVINKNIPAAAGLGGGSADAAAVLLGLNDIYGVGASYENLQNIAVKLGADVPFFINGGCKRAQGIGEKLTDITSMKSGYILLSKAESKPSTAEMYRIIDKEKPLQRDTEKVIASVDSNDLKALSYNLFNAFATVWKESELKQKLLMFNPLAVSLSGSGPTWFALFEERSKAEKAKLSLENQNIDCWLAEFEDKAIIIE